MRDSMDGMYDNNFYFNNPFDYMASERDPYFSPVDARSCYTWFTYSGKATIEALRASRLSGPCEALHGSVMLYVIHV